MLKLNNLGVTILTIIAIVLTMTSISLVMEVNALSDEVDIMEENIITMTKFTMDLSDNNTIIKQKDSELASLRKTESELSSQLEEALIIIEAHNRTIEEYQRKLSVYEDNPVINRNTKYNPSIVVNTNEYHVEFDYDQEIYMTAEQEACVIDAANTYDIPEELLIAIAYNESRFHINPSSQWDSIGAFQIRPLNFPAIAEEFNMTVSEVEYEMRNNYAFSSLSAAFLINEVLEYNWSDGYSWNSWYEVLMGYGSGPSGARSILNSGRTTTAAADSVAGYAINILGMSKEVMFGKP